MRCGSNRLPPTHPPVHPPLLACLWEISVPASAETAERRNGQVSFVFWHCAVGWDREFESAFLQRGVRNELLIDAVPFAGSMSALGQQEQFPPRWLSGEEGQKAEARLRCRRRCGRRRYLVIEVRPM